ncbi:MAG TPA: GtrA family protein [Verrucomicrobiae bacterium]|nr:GtrA family protein [Verrucomicrobiae bacterium]
MSTRGTWNSGVRWMKFNLVGAVGIGVQLAALYLLTTFGLNYLIATALAVEAAVLHNFLWHERFTWADRKSNERLARLLRFNFTTGAVSIVGNLLLMRWLAGGLHIRPMLANGIAIAACSLLNFLVSDRWVFRNNAWQS